MKTVFTLLLFCILAAQSLAAQTFQAYWTPPLGAGDTNQYTYTLWVGTQSGNYNQNFISGTTNLVLPMSTLAKLPAKNFMVVSAVAANQTLTNADGSFNLFDPSPEIVVLRQSGQILKVK